MLDDCSRAGRLAGCVLTASLAAISLATAAPPVVAAPAPVSSEANIACLASGNGFLRARLNGAITHKIDWGNAGTLCEGMPRPEGGGLRLKFSRPAGKGADGLVIVFGIAHIGENESGKTLPANLTVIVEGPKVEGKTQIFGTQGDDKCLVDRLHSQPLADQNHTRVYRIEAHGFCIQPARAVVGKGAILMSTFDFAGQVSFDDSTPRPPNRTGVTS
jgi:hypothetical protein